MTRSKSSLTKDEIEEFWKKKQLVKEEHMKEASAQGLAGLSETVQLHSWQTQVLRVG